MNSDSTQPQKKLPEESNSAPTDAEQISMTNDQEATITNSVETTAAANVNDENGDAIIPAKEIDSVLVYLQANSTQQQVDSSPETNSTTQETEAADFQEIELDLNSNDLGLSEQKNHDIQVKFKTENGKLLLILPTESQVPASEVSWSEIWQQMRLRLNASDRLRKANTTVHLVAQDRLLDSRQLQELAETLNEVKLQLKSVATSRRQTAIAACTLGYSVEQIQLQPSFANAPLTTAKPLADALYLEMTVRSGGEIRHPGTVIILGDINPGGMVIADGDILVWGRLRGVAHAGAGGNRECLIMALQMEPTQLRIADAVARAPEKSLTQFFPEVAHITPQGIRIAKATDFSRTSFSTINQNF
jgi:septum site-determining protein MinC